MKCAAAGDRRAEQTAAERVKDGDTGKRVNRLHAQVTEQPASSGTGSPTPHDAANDPEAKSAHTTKERAPSTTIRSYCYWDNATAELRLED